MATQQQQCQTCQGGGLVNQGGVVQRCPLCDGSGKAYIPGLLYTYGFTVVLTALQSVPSQAINVLNSPFKWIFAAAKSSGDFTIFLKDGKNQRQFANIPLHNSLVFGTAQNPFPVLNPYTFQQNGQILFDLVDLSNANNTIWLGFIGLNLMADSSQNP